MYVLQFTCKTISRMFLSDCCSHIKLRKNLSSPFFNRPGKDHYFSCNSECMLACFFAFPQPLHGKWMVKFYGKVSMTKWCHQMHLQRKNQLLFEEWSHMYVGTAIFYQYYQGRTTISILFFLSNPKFEENFFAVKKGTSSSFLPNSNHKSMNGKWAFGLNMFKTGSSGRQVSSINGIWPSSLSLSDFIIPSANCVRSVRTSPPTSLWWILQKKRLSRSASDLKTLFKSEMLSLLIIPRKQEALQVEREETIKRRRKKSFSANLKRVSSWEWALHLHIKIPIIWNSFVFD